MQEIFLLFGNSIFVETSLPDPVLPRVVQVEVHLAGAAVRKAADFQVDDHEASQGPVKEQQVHAVPLVPYAQPPLPAHEAESSPNSRATSHIPQPAPFIS